MADDVEKTVEDSQCLGQPAKLPKPIAEYFPLIRKHFVQPDEHRVYDLKIWYESYQNASGNIRQADPIIRNIKVDSVDETTVDRCLDELSQHVRVTNRFCDACLHLFDNWPDLSDQDPEAKELRPGIKIVGCGADWKFVVARCVHTFVMEAAARKGCRFCGFIMQRLRDAQLLVVFRTIELALLWLGDESTADLTVQNWGKNESQILWVNFPGKKNSHCNVGVAQDMKFDSGSMDADANTYDEVRDVIEISKNWIKTCVKHHDKCANDEGDNVLPTRLICVKNDEPRMVHTSGMKRRPKYSTLSHCWGSTPFLKLSVANYDAFLDKIPMAELPKSFQDAVSITKALGLKYLWIDSLCIIQDKYEDWRHEAARMRYVYGGSYVNIAASSAKNAHEGCFLKPPELVDGLRARLTLKGTEHKFVRDFRSSLVYDLATLSSHLASRAWALQEKVLPSRTIHFGNRGAFWECRCLTANEFVPGGFVRQLGSPLLNAEQRTKYFSFWWSNVVRVFTAANLTFPSDKLPAISGVAQRIHNDRGGTYLSGLWREEDMEEQLCWQVLKPQIRPQWRAPSWSWAAIDGGVRFRQSFSRTASAQYAHFLDAHVETNDDDRFGQVNGGWLKIACSGVLAAKLVDKDKVRIVDDAGRAMIPEDFLVYWDATDDPAKTEAETIYLLPIRSGESGHGRIYRNDQGEITRKVQEKLVHGLVLRRAPTEQDSFTRLGLFNFFQNYHANDGDEASHETMQPFLRLLSEHGVQVAQQICSDIFSDDVLNGGEEPTTTEETTEPPADIVKKDADVDTSSPRVAERRYMMRII